MRAPAPFRHTPPAAADGLLPASPLWRHAPARDAAGKPFCDLLLMVPALRGEPAARTLVVAQLQAALEHFGDRVVFADLNLRLGLAWITVSPEPGLTAEVVEAVRRRLPAVRVVGDYLPRPRSRWLAWAQRVRALWRGRTTPRRLRG
jgi:hypothetical protein